MSARVIRARVADLVPIESTDTAVSVWPDSQERHAKPVLTIAYNIIHLIFQ